MFRRLAAPRWIALTALLMAAAVVCMLLGWWQLQRYESAGGSGQNLGYTLQWPAFGLFALYLWWRLLRDAEQDARAATDDPDQGAPEPPAPAPAPQPDVRRVEVDPDEDPELAAYNRYLATLNERTGRD